MTKNSWLPPRHVWFPPPYDEDVINCVRAFREGIASERQQKVVWSYLMFLTGASEEFADVSFRPDYDEKGRPMDGRRETDFAEGKRFVGLMLRKLLRPEFTARAEIEAEARAAAPSPSPSQSRRGRAINIRRRK